MNNNEENGYIIYCPRCGAEMNSNSRYCMKCGNLNSDHEANKSMQPYIKDNENSYQVGSGQFISNNGIQTSIGNNTGNRKLCFIVNIIIYLLIIGISFFVSFKSVNYDIMMIRNTSFPIISIIVSIMFLYIYSVELIFMKINKPWWTGLIPVYNSMMLTDILFKNKWIGLLVIVPVIGEIVLLIIIYTIGKRFKFNGLLTVLLSFIYMPVIGFGTSLYQGRAFVDELDPIDVEKNYKRKKNFLSLIILFILVGVGLLVWNNMDKVEEGSDLVGKSYYTYAANKIVKKTRNSVKNNKVDCEGGTYNPDTGIYYFFYTDLGDYIYLPLYYQREAIEGYVKVDNNDGGKYYVSLTDGELGISETLSENIDTDKVIKLSNLMDRKSVNGIVCRIK